MYMYTYFIDTYRPFLDPHTSNLYKAQGGAQETAPAKVARSETRGAD